MDLRAGETDDATAAVIAHHLLTKLAVIAGTSAMLRDRWHELADADRLAMLNNVQSSAVEAAEHLSGIVRGTPQLVL